jgi:hypothetical protein
VDLLVGRNVHPESEHAMGNCHHRGEERKDEGDDDRKQYL